MVIAEDGRAALEILRGVHEQRIGKPYLVFLDLNMPRMNDIEFLRELREDPDSKAPSSSSSPPPAQKLTGRVPMSCISPAT